MSTCFIDFSLVRINIEVFVMPLTGLTPQTFVPVKSQDPIERCLVCIES